MKMRMKKVQSLTGPLLRLSKDKSKRSQATLKKNNKRDVKGGSNLRDRVAKNCKTFRWPKVEYLIDLKGRI